MKKKKTRTGVFPRHLTDYGLGSVFGYGFPYWGMGPWYNFDDRSWTITDDEVKDNVLEAINSDTGIPPRDRKKIKAGVKKGIVTLYGRVSQKRSRLTATDDAYWSPGVLDVVNNINLSSSH